MKLTDVLEVTKSGLAQALGHDYAGEEGELTLLNSALLVSLGEKVTSQSTFQELFMNGCIDQMAKLEIENDLYEDEEFKSMMVNKEEYGGFLARIYFEPTENFFNDPSFNPQAGTDYSAMEHTYYGAKHEQRLFTDSYDLLGAMSYSQEEMISAFKSWDEMNSFLTSKRALMRTMLMARFNVWKHAQAQCGIAISMEKTKTARNLVTEYNAFTGESVPTGWSAMYDKGFVAYLCETIANDSAYIKGLTSAFTGGNHVTFSNRSNLYLLKAVESRIRYGLRADTYNEKLLSFGDYETVKYWQALVEGGLKAFDPNTLMTVKLTKESADKIGLAGVTDEGYEANNVIALMTDWRAMGITIKRDYANASQTAVASFSTNFNHTLARGLVDEMYPIIAYTLN